jgi:ribosome small subunit-dependent GTPase A
MTQGTVLNSHAGGYLVFEPQLNVQLRCQARKRLKKERVSILTGDRVELTDLNLEAGTALIVSCRKRSSLLSRPPLANVDQVVIVQSIRQPEWNQLWCDRYIVHFQLELPGSMPVLCFNKCDLVSDDQAATLRSIYEPLGYSVVLLSAKTGQGIVELTDLIKGKITVFAGPSGVGKSSILNVLEPSLKLKIGVMDNEFGVGRHTTTYSKIYKLGGAGFQEAQEPSWVADTPGFNLAELRHPEPADLMWQFPEIVSLRRNCRFTNCLHLVEQGCFIMESLGIEPGRADGTEFGADFQDAESDEEGAEDGDTEDEGLCNDDDQGTRNADDGTRNAEDVNADSEQTTDDEPKFTNGDNGAEDHSKGPRNSLERNVEPPAEDGEGEDVSPTSMENKSAQSAEDDFQSAAPEQYYEKDEEHMPEDLIPLEVLPSRYANYVTLMAEAIEEYNIQRDTSQKVEAGVKNIAGKREKGTAKYVPRLSSKYREASRRREKQKLAPQEIFDDEEEEEGDEA